MLSPSDTATGLKCANYPRQTDFGYLNMFFDLLNSSITYHAFSFLHTTSLLALSISFFLANSLSSLNADSYPYNITFLQSHSMEVSAWDNQACIPNMFSKSQSVICANLLSNTAQALTSFVEALQEDSNATDPLPFLEEALDLFQKCLEYQELQHQEFEEQSAAAAAMGAQEAGTDDGGVSLTTDSTMDFDSENGMYSPPRFEYSIYLFKLKIIFY